MRYEEHDPHGTSSKMHEVYDMEPKTGYWDAVTDVPCPVKGCKQTVLWYEAEYVPGYRVCMREINNNTFDHNSIQHRFLAGGDNNRPTLVRL